MLMAFLTLLSGLLISGVAIYYSVAGLTSIFAAAVIPIIVMGTSLEVAKLVVTVWLKQYWSIAPKLLKAYLLIAVVILMAITSMGIFGYLSKAHSDQSLISGDVQSRIVVYDQKIQTAKENIESNRKMLQQLDSAVDQIMARSTDERGAARSSSIRRSQRAERARLNEEIAIEQAEIAKLTEDSAPIRAEIRKVEAEVGPIKYIAALIYGTDAVDTMLEDAVRWVIIMIVIVFDPLAICLLLASQYSFQQARKPKEEVAEDKFVETFLESKGTVDPEIDLEFDNPVEDTVDDSVDPDDETVEDTPADVEYDVKEHMESLEERSFENESVIDPERIVVEPIITHTKDGMIIEDAAGKMEIPAAPLILDIDSNYISVDGQMYHRKAYAPATYVQNEEQRESSNWSNIVSPKTITEEEYRKIATQQLKDHNAE